MLKRVSRYVAAARPATLGAAVVPVLVGSAIAFARGGFRLDYALYALSSAMFIQIGTNYANDVFDARSGADDERSRLGPTRAVSAGLISERAMFVAMAVAFLVATALGWPLVAAHGWPVALLGVVSILLGVAYTGGPFPLGYHGLGDVFVFLFFGVVAVTGTAYVELGFVPVEAAIASVPVGALATVILAVNNLRDHETDAVAHKRTLAVRFGPGAVRAEIVLLMVLAYVTPLVLAVRAGSPWWLLSWLSLPLGALILRDTFRETGRALNRTLVRSALCLLVFGVLFALGILMAGIARGA